MCLIGKEIKISVQKLEEVRSRRFMDNFASNFLLNYWLILTVRANHASKRLRANENLYGSP